MTPMHEDTGRQVPRHMRLTSFRTMAEYAEMGIWQWNACDTELPDVEHIEAQFVLRRQFRQDFGYVVVTAEVMTVLAELLRETGPVLDARCGSGYLSRELARRGVGTFAVDCCDFLAPRPCAQGYPLNKLLRDKLMAPSTKKWS